jgi:hypothetical protein
MKIDLAAWTAMSLFATCVVLNMHHWIYVEDRKAAWFFHLPCAIFYSLLASLVWFFVRWPLSLPAR